MNVPRYQLKTQRHSSHNKISALLEKIPPSSRILDVGIGSGSIGMYCSQGKAEVVGIEKDISLAEKGRSFYSRIVVLDLNKDEVPDIGMFDFIILADILEHLQDPFVILKKMRELLKEDGRLIVSMPNIANFAIRLKLALGNFEYQDRGLLDRDHIRFFTFKTARKLIQDAGFHISAWDFTSIPFQLFLRPEWLSNFINEIYYIFVRLFSNLFAYQFIFMACKAKKGGHHGQI